MDFGYPIEFLHPHLAPHLQAPHDYRFYYENLFSVSYACFHCQIQVNLHAANNNGIR